ncbi:MAG: tRNA (guanosine(37)-N1)-methyltransferase TrmD [Acidobacteria bacterium]|nr:tRNA (guanosine(37)-N1)-methyltransferase TrmD [Acidobacteriota bacterium]
MTIDIVTIFPEFFSGPFEHGMIRRARETGLMDLAIHDLRQFTEDRHKTVDDRPFGGEEGMVLKPEPLFRAVAELQSKRQSASGRGRVILLSAQGQRFRQPQAARLAREDRLIFLCGRYEGVDERVAEYLADEELSIGDYVLSGGELAAAVVVDTIARLLPGVLGNAQSAVRESFSVPVNVENGVGSEAEAGSEEAVGILDCPHYTRPAVYTDLHSDQGSEMPREMKVPEALLSGNHRQIEIWRRRKALEKTWKNRPDLLRIAKLDAEQRGWLEELKGAERMNSPARKADEQ